VREAKKRGISVTCETAPHYFTLIDECVRGYDANFKMKPPLCPIESVNAIKIGLKDGTIDVIATDHAPHEFSEKEVEFVSAPFGVVGLETALPLILNLVRENVLTPLEAIKKVTINPAKVIGIPKGSLGIGRSADITIIDPESSWRVNSNDFFSKGRNTPFQGLEMVGEIDRTIVGGKIVYKKKSKEL
jgi:dihydroorotase